MGRGVAAHQVAAVALLEREDRVQYQVVVAVLLLVLVGPEVTMVAKVLKVVVVAYPASVEALLLGVGFQVEMVDHPLVDRRARADRGVVQESVLEGIRGRCRDQRALVVLDVEAVPVEGEVLEVEGDLTAASLAPAEDRGGQEGHPEAEAWAVVPRGRKAVAHEVDLVGKVTREAPVVCGCLGALQGVVGAFLGEVSVDPTAASLAPAEDHGVQEGPLEAKA